MAPTVAALAASALQAALFFLLWAGSGSPLLGFFPFIVLVTVWTVAESECQSRFAAHPGRRDGADWTSVTAGALLLLSLALASFGPLQCDRTEMGTAVLLASGAVLAVTGIGLRCLAIAKLGKFFHNDISLSPGQKKITSGIYRYLRHPSELGSVLAVSGICLAAANPFAAAFAIGAMTPLALIRIRRENAVMELCPAAG